LRSIAESQGRKSNPKQKSATVGIRPMERPTLVTRFFMRIVEWVEHFNLALSAVENPPIYDKTIFPWTQSIESEWRTIHTELQRVLARQEDLPAFHELAPMRRWSATIADGRASY